MQREKLKAVKNYVLSRADRAGDEAAFALARIVGCLPADVSVALKADIDYVINYMACGAEVMAQVAELDNRAEDERRAEWGDVRLTRGRILTPVEQEKLIALIDRFMDYRAINSARHSASEIDETACGIEELLTGAGWYPDAESLENGGGR